MSKGADEEIVEKEAEDFAVPGFFSDALSHLKYNMALPSSVRDSSLNETL